jgi:hypothetical protein
VAERTNAAVLKTVGRREASRGFESLPLRCKENLAGRAEPLPHHGRTVFQGAAYIAALSAARPELGAGMQARLAWLRERLAY